MGRTGRAPLVPALFLAVAPLAAGVTSALPPTSLRCSASVDFYGDFLNVVASPDQETHAAVMAAVHVTKPSAVSARMTVAASTDVGWHVAASPSSIVVEETGGTYGIQLVVTLPPAEPAGTAGRITIVVELESSIYPCEGASSSDFTVTVSPTVDRFAGFIVPESIVVTDEARHVEFRVELEAVANAPIEVSIEYLVDSGVSVDAPRFLVLNPQQGGRDNVSINVVITAPNMHGESYEFTMVVQGEVEGHPPLRGDLGMTVAVPGSTAADSTILPPISARMGNALLVAVLTWTIGAAAPVGWSLHRRVVRARRIEARRVSRLSARPEEDPLGR